MAAVTATSEYPEFKGIWKFIDFNEWGRLLASPELQEVINAKQRGYTPLYLACSRHNERITKILLESGADPNLISRGKTPLLLSTLHNDQDIVSMLLNYGAEPNTLIKNVSALHLAVSKGVIELCDLLVAYGADISLNSPQYGTPLHLSIRLNHKYIAEYLVSKGAQLRVLNSDGETCIYTACKFGNSSILETMLPHSHEKDCSVVDPETGYTPLHIAAKERHYEIVNTLTERLVSILDKNMKSVLFYLPSEKKKVISGLYLKSLQKPVSFASLVNNNSHADIELVADDGTVVPAHYPLLFARWPTLRQKMDILPRLEIPKYDSSTLRSFLYYLYTDNIKVFPSTSITAGQNKKEAEKADMAKLRDLALEEEQWELARLCDSLLGQAPSPSIPKEFKEDPFPDQLKRLLVSDESKPDVVLHVKEGEGRIKPCSLLNATSSKPCLILRSLSESRVEIDCMELPILNAIIEYIYSHKLPKDSLMSNTDMLEATNRFMLHELNILCQFALIEHLSESNACTLLHLADAYNAAHLKEACLDRIMRYYNLMNKRDEYRELSPALRKEITQYFSAGL